MSSSYRHIECPQCGFGQAIHYLEIGTMEECTMCHRCGYEEEHVPKRDDDGAVIGIHTINHGAGAIAFWPTGVVSVHYLHSVKAVREAEKWIREEIAAGIVEAAQTYVSRWDADKKCVEMLVGEFYEKEL